MNKTKKFITKRIRITKTGKLMRRKSGQSHYNAKKSGGKVRARKLAKTVTPSDVKTINRFI